MELEEQCKSEQKNIFKLTALQNSLLLDNNILKNKLTLTIQNIYVTQATTAQSKANKMEL